MLTVNAAAWIYELDIAAPNLCGGGRGGVPPWLPQEPDSDGDGVPDSMGQFPYDPERTIDFDVDRDAVPDPTDNCPGVANPAQLDSDEDYVGDMCDNCALFNPDQADCQPNGAGDVCDIAFGTSQDCNTDGAPDECDPPPESEVPGSTCDDGADNDCDTLIDCDDPDCRVPFADIVPEFCPPDCPQPDLDDIMCLLSDFADGPTVNGCGTNNPPVSTDLAPCGGDGVLDLDDILCALDAFGQVFACPHPCP